MSKRPTRTEWRDGPNVADGFLSIACTSRAHGSVTKATAEAALHEMLFSGGGLNTRPLGGEAVTSDALSQ